MGSDSRVESASSYLRYKYVCCVKLIRMNIRLEFFKVEFSKTNVSQIAQIEKKISVNYIGSAPRLKVRISLLETLKTYPNS